MQQKARMPPFAMGAAATELYDLYVNQGNGKKDFSGIINFLRRKEAV